MEYELIRNCRFGKEGDVVGYSTYLGASWEERRTCFKAIIKSQNSSESHGVTSDNDLIYGRRVVEDWCLQNDADDYAKDNPSSVSSSPSREDNFDYGGGSFGGGGASSDYESSGYGDTSDCGSDD
jgi:uncharacterized membrane protein YgcG